MRDQLDIIVDFIHKTHELLLELEANTGAATCPIIGDDDKIRREVIDPELADQIQELLDLSYQYMNMEGPVLFEVLPEEE